MMDQESARGQPIDAVPLAELRREGAANVRRWVSRPLLFVWTSAALGNLRESSRGFFEDDGGQRKLELLTKTTDDNAIEL
ncbi:unnamed protein product [Diplocarpon coronariae]